MDYLYRWALPIAAGVAAALLATVVTAEERPSAHASAPVQAVGPPLAPDVLERLKDRNSGRHVAGEYILSLRSRCTGRRSI